MIVLEINKNRRLALRWPKTKKESLPFVDFFVEAFFELWPSCPSPTGRVCDHRPSNTYTSTQMHAQS
jgi:hypothetical protein